MKKLLCYSKNAFDCLIKKNKWTDEFVPLNACVGGGDVAFISINEPLNSRSDESVKYYEKSIFHSDHPNVIRLNFDDIDPNQFKEIYDKSTDEMKEKWVIYEESPDFWRYKGNIGMDNEYELTIFNPKQAEKLYNFIKNNIGKDFYIHCAAGVSRSQGVVMFMLSRYPFLYDESSLNPDNKPNALCYNKWVTKLLQNEANLDFSEELRKFEDKFINNQKDIEPDFANFIDEHFDELLYKE